MNENHGRELSKSITRHLGDQWMTWIDQPLGSVSRICPRADVLAIAKRYSLVIRIYEVKVSRGDFQRDVFEDKYKKYFPFCHYLYFATPQGLLKKEEIPEDCGLITFSNRGWSSIKTARKRDIAVSQDLWLCLMMKGYQDNYEKYRDLENRRLTKNWEYQGFADAAREFGLKLAHDVTNSQEYLKEAQELKTKIEAAAGQQFEAIFQAIQWLNREVSSLLGKYKFGKEAGEVMEVAMNLFNGYPWNAADKLREIAGRLEKKEVQPNG